MIDVRMLDLCCGSFAVGKVFAERGWDVVGVDLIDPPEVPKGCTFLRINLLQMSVGPVCRQIYYADESGDVHSLGRFDFIWASTPCDEFSCWTMKMFQPNPKHPALGIRLFSHAKHLCESSGSLYVLENVRGAQQFVGDAISHCGPFYMWGNAVPPIVPQGITKTKWYRREGKPGNFAAELALSKRQRKAILATIPTELSGCVADYASALQCA